MTNDRDDRGSLPMAMLIALVGLTVSGLLGSALIAQVRNVRRTADRGLGLASAEAGLQVAMGSIRAAVGIDGKGSLSRLPCGTIEGAISGAPGSSYRVEVTYRSATGAVMTCPPTTTPATAVVNSRVVTDGSAGGTALGGTTKARVLEATYPFRVPVAQVPAGLVRNYPDGTLCMDAVQEQPSAGDPVLMTTCDPQRPQRQMFAYVKSMAVAHPRSNQSTGTDMCLDATKPASGTFSYVTFQPCAVALDDTTTQSPIRQLWSLHASYAAFAGTDDGKTLNGWCVVQQNPGASGTRLIYTTCPNAPANPYNAADSMALEPSVGAGAAGESTGQLVNYKQFGRCLDVTEGKVDYEYLIAWPCTANPDPAGISWNERWTLPAVTNTKTGGIGQVTTVSGKKNTTGYGKTFCLRSPLSTDTGKFVTTTLCSGAAAAEVTWTRYLANKNSTKAYTLVDSAGNCLQPSETELYTRAGDKIGALKVAKCDGANLLQKWNAVIAAGTGLTNVQER
ncbi:hypothetical protein GCM10010168_58680 [Actinoplanes ianthinogenes]|uniref:Ricin-type beta-trefoil lectin protein n=1 Tax=Actinoplanes ianthinogenes TaxID=122358 RepID=A0ABN6CL06_9ACTN|nr:hypothetical protein [Actinoplanes ianthinogenes]BCJ45712.1 hypothetical protein Aiant_63690 [Actinoplanes ianthinogenes]GGR32499.1 hypothetical protein GCM10010168_58680 [Actinoplanes ianthinogenes]